MSAVKRTATLVCCIALVLAFAGTSAAQVTTGTLFGRVVDPSGAVLPGATVTATNTLTSTSKTTVTDGRGQFVLTFLPVGTYNVTIEMQGFKTRTETGLEVSSGDEITVRYQMEIGAQTEQITVVSEAPLINASSAEQDIRVSSEKVAELPVNRRDITNLLNTGPGSSAGGGQISMNGLASYGFTFSVDGVDASPDSERPSLGLYQNYNFIKGISMEAVKEVEVSKNIFSAEIGMTVAGNVNIISKSGTNEFHGSAFEYYQSGGMNAVNHFTSEKVSTVYHQFGASLGGPIVKDKLFFFGTYEGYRLTEQEPQSGQVPAVELRNAVLAAIPGSQPYWDLWPEPTGPSPDGRQAPFAGAFQKLQDDNHFVGRLDFNASDVDYLTARYTSGRPNFLDPRIAPGNSRDRVGLVENFAFTYTRVLNPTTTTELRFGWNKNETQRVDLIVPAQAVTIEVPGVPDTAGELFIKNGTNWSVENTWSLVRGDHALKFGGIARFWKGSRINEEQPVYEFRTVDDLLRNDADVAAYQFGLEEFEITSFDMGVFVQDDWRVNPDLMLNLGVRWDYSGVPEERDGRFFNRDGPFGGAETGQGFIQYRDPDSTYDAFYGMVSPRVGFAYTIDERTVLRGGAGVFYIPFNLFAGPVEIVQNSLGQPVEADVARDQLQALGIQYPAPNDVARPLVSTACDTQALTCPTTGVVSDSSLDIERTNPFSVQWTLGISRQLTDTLAFDIAYVGNQGNDLTYSPQFNRRDRATGIQPVAGFGRFRHYIQTDTSKYHALQTSLRRRFQDDIGFGIHYTYASNTVGFLGDFTCCSSDEQAQRLDPRFGASLDLSQNRGLPGFYQRHRVFADVLWELPLGDSLFADGWRIGVLADFQGGSSLLIRDEASTLDGDRPDFSGSSAQDAVLSGWGDPPYQFIDPSVFPRVALDPDSGAQERPGNAGRRFVTGPPFWTVDLTVTKDFRFENFSLQLRGDLFNALNKTNLSNPEDDLSDNDFGFITSQRGTGRVTQLAVRVRF